MYHSMTACVKSGRGAREMAQGTLSWTHHSPSSCPASAAAAGALHTHTHTLTALTALTQTVKLTVLTAHTSQSSTY